MKLWDEHKMDASVESFTVGNDFLLDSKLVQYDCRASEAHAKMLMKMKIITVHECENIIQVLNEIIALNNKGMFSINKDDEDVHTAIEKYLTEKLGDVGKKIHTARSRNDQVLAALRLLYKDGLKGVDNYIDRFISALKEFDKTYGKVVFPGFTHTRKAMPSSVSLWAGAFIESMKDNKKFISQVLEIIDQNPLGTGAGYGIPIKIDRELTTKELGFSRIQQNPLYVQNSRGKFEYAILHALDQTLLDTNKMATDIIWFSLPELGYFVLSDDVVTGSSIMPHKKNPDVLELVRGHSAKMSSYVMRVKSLSTNLISGYNRDMQLTKEPVIKAFGMAKEVLHVMSVIISKMSVDQKACKSGMSEELYATEKAYDLVKKGTPFREAYKEIAKEFK